MNGVCGHCLDEVCTLRLLPDRDDDKFSKVKVVTVLTSSGMGPRGGGKFSMIRVTFV